MASQIEHKAVVVSLEPHIQVKMERISACASCRTKHICGMDEKSEKIVDITERPKETIEIGDEVTIYIEQRLGNVALFWGYLMPFIVLVVTLFTLLALQYSEGVAGLFSVGVLVPYYFILYLLKDRLKKEFEFKIRT